MQYSVKRMVMSMVVALSVVLSTVSYLPMNVFAGGGHTGLPDSDKEITISGFPEEGMKVGDTCTLTATTKSGGIVTWESIDSTVATVGETVVPDANNPKVVTTTVTAVGPGETTIKAKVGEMEDTCKITVQPTFTVSGYYYGGPVSLEIEFYENPTWQDMVDKYSDYLKTRDHHNAPDGKIIHHVVDGWCELKSNSSAHAYNLVALSDKVLDYPLNSYYFGE